MTQKFLKNKTLFFLELVSSELERWRKEALERGDQLSQLRSIKEQLEGKCISYEQELKRTRQILESKDRDIESLNERIRRYE